MKLIYLLLEIKIVFNLLDDELFTIPHFTDTIPNSSDVHQLPTEGKKNVWIIAINGEEPITDQVALDELNHHQNPHGKIQGKYQSMHKEELL